MKEKYWDEFTRTGKVADYLSYRGMDICSQVMERWEAAVPTAGSGENAVQTGGIISESDYSDRDGASCISYR